MTEFGLTLIMLWALQTVGGSKRGYAFIMNISVILFMLLCLALGNGIGICICKNKKDSIDIGGAVIPTFLVSVISLMLVILRLSIPVNNGIQSIALNVLITIFIIVIIVESIRNKKKAIKRYKDMYYLYTLCIMHITLG